MVQPRYVGPDRVSNEVGTEDGVIAAPDYLWSRMKEQFPDRNIIPHHALLPGGAIPDLTILHKELLTRISIPALRGIINVCCPVFADEQFLLLRPAARLSDPVRPDWLAEVEGVRVW